MTVTSDFVNRLRSGVAFLDDAQVCKEPIDLMAPRQVGLKGWEYGLHLEHAVALRHGGSDLKSNVKPAHGLCNLKKHSKLEKENKI